MNWTIRSLLAALLILVSLPSFATDLEEPDKQKHMQASAAIATASYGAARIAKMSRWKSVWISTVVTLGVGIAKELSDPFFDEEDMHANMSGTAVGLLVPISFDF